MSVQPWQAPIPITGPGGKASPEWLRWLQQLLAAGVAIDSNSTNITQLKSLIASANESIASLETSIAALKAITLETNFALNGSQTLLNLVAGANITLSDNGAGDITIAASASGIFTPAGDLAGTATLQTVIGLQTVPVTTAPPTDGEVLTYVAADGKWEGTVPGTPILDSSTGLPIYDASGNWIYPS